MPYSPEELGDRQHLDFMTGVSNVEAWRGVNREGDPASIADTQLWNAENARLTGGLVVSRGGQLPVNTIAAGGSIDGFYDAGDMGAANPLVLAPAGAGLYNIISTNQDWFIKSETPPAYVRDDLDIFGIILFIKKFNESGQVLLGTLGNALGNPVYIWQWEPVGGFTEVMSFDTTYTDSSYCARGIYTGVSYGPDFFFSVWQTEELTAVPYDHHLLVYRWDGVNAPVVEVDYIVTNTFAAGGETSFDTPGAFNTWALYSNGEDVFAIQKAAIAFATSGNVILKRNGGSWTSLTLPTTHFGVSSRHAAVSFGQLVSYNGDTYICGQDCVGVSSQDASPRILTILKYDGSSVTSVWTYTCVAADGQGDGHINMFVADGTLYFNYSDPLAPVSRTGSFNGTTWTDNVKDWSAAPQSSAIPNNVVEYAGEFWGSVGGTSILTTTSRAVTGTWTAGVSGSDIGLYVEAVD